MALAKATGIPFYRFWKIENEYLEPKDADRLILAAYLGVPDALIFPDAPPLAPAPAPDADAATV